MLIATTVSWSLILSEVEMSRIDHSLEWLKLYNNFLEDSEANLRWEFASLGPFTPASQRVLIKMLRAPRRI